MNRLDGSSLLSLPAHQAVETVEMTGPRPEASRAHAQIETTCGAQR
jgi:hypothetical protein